MEEIKWLSTVRALIARRASSTLGSLTIGPSGAGAGPAGSTVVTQPSTQTPTRGSAHGTHDQSRGSFAGSGSNSGSKNKRADAEAGFSNGGVKGPVRIAS